jgi:uncharacterized protein YxeA
MTKRLSDKGFTALSIMVAVLVIIVVIAAGLYIWHHSKQTKTAAKNSNVTHEQRSTTEPQGQPTNPYATWKTYTDSGYSAASDITIKYPADWQVKVGGSNAFAWEILQSAPPNVSVNVRDVFLSPSTTPQQEWESCPSADACGPAPGSSKIEGSTSSINGLDAYATKMQSSSGVTYYATVIKSNKPISNGEVAFVEFIVNNPDQPTLNIYNQIVDSATFN